MNVKDHVIVSAIITVFIFPVYSWLSLLVFLGGVLIDIDHYLWWIFNKKNFSLKTAYKFFKDDYNGKEDLTLIFHSIEFWALSLVMVYFFPVIFPYFIGLASHITMDLFFFFKFRKTHPHPVAYCLTRKYLLNKHY
ncbi:hypothetical protein J4434_00250 [Candidatus Woesearchaeota archaeon]|nr:hypothetical protein [Candidatus Woesearchaeota archaeon]